MDSSLSALSAFATSNLRLSRKLHSIVISIYLFDNEMTYRFIRVLAFSLSRTAFLGKQ